MTKELQKKVDFAIKLLQSIPTDDGPIELSYSSGKDSDVILELAKMAGIPYRAIYKNTTIDPIGAIAHAKEAGAEIIRPEKTFFQLIREKGLPNRFRRFCCESLKEYAVCARSVQGIRRAESVKRAKNYKEPEICRTYPGKQKVRVYLPILEWTDEDVAEFIKERNIKCHPLYYKNGQFDVTQRLGCIGCPLIYEKKRIEQFKQYPKLLRLWIKNANIYMRNHPDNKNMFKDAFEQMYAELFFHNIKDYDRDTLFGEINHKEILENTFNINLDGI